MCSGSCTSACRTCLLSSVHATDSTEGGNLHALCMQWRHHESEGHVVCVDPGGWGREEELNFFAV
jgi:hypothetical protein